MDLARETTVEPDHHHWVISRTQSKGRGRLGRSWMASKGAFLGTLIINPNCAAQQAAQWSFGAAVAIFRSLSEYTRPEMLGQKWPNDVLLQGGKVAGILLESSGRGRLVDQLLIGIGVNLTSAPEGVQNAAFRPVCLGDVIEYPPCRDQFLETLAGHCLAVHEQLNAFGFESIRSEWLSHAARLGEVITANTGKEVLEGTFKGVDPDGNLILLTAAGQRVIPAADIFF